MKNTKELRKQFADAIMDGRFDGILEEHIKSNASIECADRLWIAAKIIETAVVSDKRMGFLKEYSHEYAAFDHPRSSEIWEITHGNFQVQVELRERENLRW